MLFRSVLKGIIGLCVALVAAPFVIMWLWFCTAYGFGEDALGLPLIFFFPVALVFGLLGLNVLVVMAASYLAPSNGIYFRRDKLPRYWTPSTPRQGPQN